MCDNLLGPPCRNPWNLEGTSGASSGGAGAAIAAGLGPVAHGSDGAGSIRIPSALCGVFGLKPSYGRVPYHPSSAYFALRAHPGPMARALLARSVFYTAVRAFFGTYDLLLTPQMPVAAWSVEPGPDEGLHEINGQPAPTMFDRLPFTYPFNLTGHPAASVPCGFTREGLPVGLQIVGRWHADVQVLRAAAW